MERVELTTANDRVMANPEDLVFKVDKGDGRVSWLYADDGVLRAHREAVHEMDVPVSMGDLRLVLASRYELTVEDRDDAPV